MTAVFLAFFGFVFVVALGYVLGETLGVAIDKLRERYNRK